MAKIMIINTTNTTILINQNYVIKYFINFKFITNENDL